MREKQNTDQTADVTAEGGEHIKPGSVPGFPKEIETKLSFLIRLKSVCKNYSGTIGFVLLYLIILVYPTIVNLVNPAPPENQLKWISGKVVFVQQDHPNIRLEMADGSKREFDFYANLTGISRGLPRFYGATNIELAKLKDCQAKIGFGPIRWLIFPHNDRAWEVRSECFSLPYATLLKESIDASDIHPVMHVCMIIFAIVVFIAERFALNTKMALR